MNLNESLKCNDIAAYDEEITKTYRGYNRNDRITHSYRTNERQKTSLVKLDLSSSKPQVNCDVGSFYQIKTLS